MGLILFVVFSSLLTLKMLAYFYMDKQILFPSS